MTNTQKQYFKSLLKRRGLKGFWQINIKKPVQKIASNKEDPIKENEKSIISDNKAGLKQNINKKFENDPYDKKNSLNPLKTLENKIASKGVKPLDPEIILPKPLHFTKAENGLSEIRIGVLVHDQGPFSSHKEDGYDGYFDILFTSPDFLEVVWSPRPHT